VSHPRREGWVVWALFAVQAETARARAAHL